MARHEDTFCSVPFKQVDEFVRKSALQNFSQCSQFSFHIYFIFCAMQQCVTDVMCTVCALMMVVEFKLENK